jgi:hypothetical protein
MFDYESLYVDGFANDGHLHTPYPPAVGDTIGLHARNLDLDGVFRVIARDWTPVQYGSANWPHGQQRPKAGPILQLIVELAEGPFQNEAPRPVDADEDFASS